MAIIYCHYFSPVRNNFLFFFFGGGGRREEVIPNKYCLAIFPTWNKENGYKMVIIDIYQYMFTCLLGNSLSMALISASLKSTIKKSGFHVGFQSLMSCRASLMASAFSSWTTEERSNNTVIYIGFHTEKECGESN